MGTDSDAVWVKVDGQEVPAEGELARIKIAGRALVIAQMAGRLHALDDRCPHAGASLSMGQIDEGKIVCAWHGRAYDPATGLCEGYQGVRPYAVEQRDEGVFVRIDDTAAAP